MEVKDDNLHRAIEQIERGGGDQPTDDIPIEERGGEVLESVNEVFNLMAMKIETETKARHATHQTLKYKNLPNVIYVKNARDRLLLMTESVDQSFQEYPLDHRGHYGGQYPLEYEKEEILKKRLQEERDK